MSMDLPEKLLDCVKRQRAAIEMEDFTALAGCFEEFSTLSKGFTPSAAAAGVMEEIQRINAECEKMLSEKMGALKRDIQTLRQNREGLLAYSKAMALARPGQGGVRHEG